MTIALTPVQIKKILDDFELETSTLNYTGMYKYIYENFGSQMPNNKAYRFE